MVRCTMALAVVNLGLLLATAGMAENYGGPPSSYELSRLYDKLQEADLPLPGKHVQPLPHVDLSKGNVNNQESRAPYSQFRSNKDTSGGANMNLQGYQGFQHPALSYPASRVSGGGYYGSASQPSTLRLRNGGGEGLYYYRDSNPGYAMPSMYQEFQPSRAAGPLRATDGGLYYLQDNPRDALQQEFQDGQHAGSAEGQESNPAAAGSTGEASSGPLSSIKGLAERVQSWLPHIPSLSSFVPHLPSYLPGLEFEAEVHRKPKPFSMPHVPSPNELLHHVNELLDHALEQLHQKHQQLLELMKCSCPMPERCSNLLQEMMPFNKPSPAPFSPAEGSSASSTAESSEPLLSFYAGLTKPEGHGPGLGFYVDQTGAHVGHYVHNKQNPDAQAVPSPPGPQEIPYTSSDITLDHNGAKRKGSYAPAVPSEQHETPSTGAATPDKYDLKKKGSDVQAVPSEPHESHGAAGAPGPAISKSPSSDLDADHHASVDFPKPS